MRISFVATILNEEKNIKFLLSSLIHQTKKPDEIIIVDGGSKDKSVQNIRDFISGIKSEKIRRSIKLISKKGNRSVGRNEGILKSKGEVIVLSDAGCIPDKNWVKNITKPFGNNDIEVVSGYYKGVPISNFAKSLIPYVLVMRDRVNPKEFLPSGRSMAFRKSIWKRFGGFPRECSGNEDYVFAKRLKKVGVKFIFRKNAIVYWIPRKNIFEAFVMFFRFAIGDSEAGIFRPKAILIILRYLIILWIIVLSSYLSPSFSIKLASYILVLYITWAIWKNFKYVKEKSAFFYLPLIQIVSDMAVIFGTTLGFLKGVWDTKDKQ